MIDKCKWQEDEDGNWHTGCGNAFCFIDGAPDDSGMKFCCYCGKSLGPARYIDPESWYCDFCDKPMSEDSRGYARHQIGFCSEACANEHDATHGD